MYINCFLIKCQNACINAISTSIHKYIKSIILNFNEKNVMGGNKGKKRQNVTIFTFLKQFKHKSCPNKEISLKENYKLILLIYFETNRVEFEVP